MKNIFSEISDIRQQMFKYEPLVLITLSGHGALAMLSLGGKPWHWLALSIVLLLGVVGWRYPRMPLLVRVMLFVLVTWFLLYTTGGVGSFFLLWYFVTAAFYPLLFDRPTNLLVAGGTALAYVLLLPFSGTAVPVFIVLVRAFLLVFIGWLVSVLGDDLVDYAVQRRNSEENMLRILGVSPTAILVARMVDGRYLDVNEHFVQLTGYERDEIVGKISGDISFWAASRERETYLAMIEAQGVVHNFEIRLRRKSGVEGNVIVNSEVVTLNGEACLVTFVHDVTEWRKTEEEKLYQANLLDNVSDAVVSTDAAFAIRSWNKGAEALYGWLAEEAMGRRISELLPTTYPDADGDAVTAQFLEQGYWQGEVIHMCRDGTRRNVLSAVSSIKNEQGELVGAVGVNRDITMQKELQAALQQQEARYEAVVEGQTDLISRHLPDSTVTFVNEAYCRFFGHVREDLIGRKIADFLAVPLMEIFRDKMLRLTPENPVETDEHLEKRADGMIRWLQWTDQGIFDEAGELVEIQSVGRDVTPLKEAQNQLQSIINTVPEGVLLVNANGYVRLANPVAEVYLAVLWRGERDGRLHQIGDQRLIDLLTTPTQGFWHEIVAGERYFEALGQPVELGVPYSDWVLVLREVTEERQMQRRVQEQERLSAVGKLAAGIAHDFNNILAVITLYTQMLLQSPGLDSRSRDRMQVINQQSHRASELVQQILDFSRQSILARQALEMRHFLSDLVRLLRRTLPENIQVVFDSDGENHLVYADSARMQQVVINLAINARDAMPEGGRLLIRLSCLHLLAEETPPQAEMLPGSWVVIEVADNGSGIAPEVRSRIFEPFFTTKEVGKGTGLGLAQVYGIVQQHQGFLEVVTEPGRGTTFLLYFPAYGADDEAATAVAAPLPLGQQQTVLLVEDNVVARQALVDTLEFLNYRVLEVANGRNALTLLTEAEHEVDLILSDVVMPELGGMALFQAVRQRGLAVPMVLMTGHPLGEELEGMQAAGLAGWLPKPPNIETLARLLYEVMVGG
ncbi:MAG: PAS domain S-box protein [Ardenticatenaceae bacterium]|nr:PAS domain S-box protein [Ardenticatenaceae bacterium]